MTELVSHPPKYELEDGSIQVWRGMPKLPDVVQVMLENREKAYVAKEQHRRRQEEMEYKRLEKRREEHPEEFFGWPDIVKKAKEMKLETKLWMSMLQDTENVSPILLGADGGARERELARQKKEIEAREKNANTERGE